MHVEGKGNKTTKAILKTIKGGEISLPDFKTHYEAALDQKNRIENLEMDSHT